MEAAMLKNRAAKWSKRRWLLALPCFFSFALLISPFEVEAQTSARTGLRVGIIGDQTFSTDIQESYGVLKRGVEILRKENVACVVHTGDLVESNVSPAQYTALFEQATNVLDELRRPWSLAPGDHDVNPPFPPFVPDSTDRSREKLFYDLYRRRVPQLTKTLNHSFDLRGYHFVALNSQEHLSTDPRWGDVFLNKISADQFSWLKNDLERHRTGKGIIIFLHQPMWYNWTNWAAVHQLLRRYPVLAVVAGHFHYDQDEGRIDNIRYLVVGATGGNLKQASRDAGGVHHVTVMTIRGRKVEFRLIPIDEAEPLQITPRGDMDRVQAIDVLLGELFSFGSQNTICVKDNRLFNEKMEPAKLSLVPVGNPIDQPVKLALQLLSEKLTLKNPQFMASGCQQLLPDATCVMAPGARVESSNNSSVVLNNRFAPLPPLWESGLEVKQGATISAGDVIQLKVRLSFQGAQGEQVVERVATATIKACSP
jgi:hypothetical protein